MKPLRTGLYFLSGAVILMGLFSLRNQAPVHIYYPLHASSEEVHAAQELARVLQVRTKESVLVAKEPYCFALKGFYVGNTRQGRRLLPELLANRSVSNNNSKRPPFDPAPPRTLSPQQPKDWDHVGWATPEKGQEGIVAIAANDSASTLLAVSRFLNQECGVRWWRPGPLGEDVPGGGTPILPPGIHVIEAPSFYSRDLYGIPGEAGQMWKAHNLLRGHVHMNHALLQYLTPDVAHAHPEWFPQSSGHPFDPDTPQRFWPQPRFELDALQAFIASSVCRFFEQNPTRLTASISPADTANFGDMEGRMPAPVSLPANATENEAQARQGDQRDAFVFDPKASFRQKADDSALVFHFYNEVARRVRARFPERYLGALAYSFYENVPRTSLEPNLMPFFCVDRSQWYDEERRDEDLALVERLSSSGARYTGVWDYNYGLPYVVPRVLLDVITEGLPALYQNGVRLYYAELCPRWGYDAPKAWLSAQLLWKAGADTEALTQEFFMGCYGPAAKPMRAFFEFCDRVWMHQKGAPRWLRYWADADQGLLLSDSDMEALQSLLEEAIALVGAESVYYDRVALVASDFSNTQRLHMAWTAWERVAQWTPEHPAKELENALPDYFYARKDMAALIALLAQEDSISHHATLGYLEDDEPLAGRLALLSSRMVPSDRERLAERLPQAFARVLCDGDAWRLCQNATAGGLKGWRISHWPNPQLHCHVPRVGEPYLEVAGANRFCAKVEYSVQGSGSYLCAFRASGRVDASATVRLLMECIGEDGRVLGFSADRLAPGDALDEALLAVYMKTPEGCMRVRISLIVKDQQAGNSIRFLDY